MTTTSAAGVHVSKFGPVRTIYWVMFLLMVGAAVLGIVAVPKSPSAGRPPSIVLNDAVPTKFEGWTEVSQPMAQVVNPQTQQLLDKLYSQILTRTYKNADGYAVMLSLAYGNDQRGALQAHKPEVCYPAQGFSLLSNAPGLVATGFGDIEVRRLNTSLGQRREPITYWFTVANRTVKTTLDKRWLELKLMLTGEVPDGLLFRVSSIDDNPQHAYQMQDKFIVDLLTAADVSSRQRLSGLSR